MVKYHGSTLLYNIGMQKVFEYKKVNFEKLVKYGFKKENDFYVYSVLILQGQFEVKLSISLDGDVFTDVFDVLSGEIYTLHLVEGAKGSFIGKVKEEYDFLLKEICEKCFDENIFKSCYTKEIINFIKEKYNDELEFLWKKSPNNAIVRRKDNTKWYAAVLTVQKNKLGLNGTEKIEILDLRMNPEEKENLIDNEKFFSGYHMNKNHWMTICLDGSVAIEQICKRIDISYEIAGKK